MNSLDEVPSSTNLRDKTVKSLFWNITAQFTRQTFRFIISVILARLLTPNDFGLIGMIVVFTGFAGLFSELGFGPALIQKKDVEDRHLSSIFWLNIVIGLLLTIIVLLIAPLISSFYNEPILKSLAMLISINFFISSLKTVQMAILNRSMDFRKIAIIETTAVIVAGIFAIILAHSGFGVWSLAWQLLISTTLVVFILWLSCDWKPTFCFDKNSIRELLGFSSHLFGFNVFNYWVRNIDDLLIGKFIGSVSLGIYTRAYNTMSMPLRQMSATIGRVMFPSLSKIQDDKLRVKQIYLKAIGAIALVTFPMMMGLFVLADSFVLALLGYKWKAVIPVLRILCLLGMIQSINTTVGWIYNSQGRTDWQFKWGIVAGTLLISSIIIGVLLGNVISVAICYSVMSGIILTYPNFVIPGKLINMTFSEVVNSVSDIFISAVIMAGGVWLVKIALPNELPHWSILLIMVPFGIALYIMLIHILKPEAYFNVKELFREQWADYSQISKSYD